MVNDPAGFDIGATARDSRRFRLGGGIVM